MNNAGIDLSQNLDSEENARAEFERVARRNHLMNLLQLTLVAVIAAVYLTHLSPGHTFVSDDFAAYVMHAANLAEGRPYTAIHYVPNPETLWLAPPEGYPPVYPLILTPVYRVWGLDLWALKIVTVLCFVAFLLIFSEFTRPYLSLAMSCCALVIVGFNPVFWRHKDVLLSEFPYLMFSFASLLAIQRAYRNLAADQFRIGMALLLGMLLYLTYGTRTIGIVLLAALALADIIQFKKPSRFLMAVLAVVAILIVAQNLLFFSPMGYSGAVQHSFRMALNNAVFYGKTLSYVWQNGFSKKIQIAFALLFTALTTARFVRRLWTQRSAAELYLLGYMGMLLLLRAEIGMRGLLPILPLYLAWGLEELGRIVHQWGRMTWTVSLIVLMSFVGVSYAKEIRKESHEAREPNIQDPTARELFTFLRAATQPSEAIIFQKPRVLALFTNRPAAMLAPTESPEDSARFMKSIHADILVKTDWSPPSTQAFLESKKGQPLEIFHNSGYQVFRIQLDEATPPSTHRARE